MKKATLSLLLFSLITACTIESGGEAPYLEEFRIFNRTIGGEEIYRVNDTLNILVVVKADQFGSISRELVSGLFMYQINGTPGDTLVQLGDVSGGWAITYIFSLNHLQLDGTPYTAKVSDEIQFSVLVEDSEGEQSLFEKEIVINP